MHALERAPDQCSGIVAFGEFGDPGPERDLEMAPGRECDRGVTEQHADALGRSAGIQCGSHR
jgi:hypothetical protein